MASLPASPEELSERARRIKAIIVDIDGVLTDGRIIYAEHGDELKFFDVQDGAGLVFWHRAGLRSAIISGRKSSLAKRRAREMQVDFLQQGALIKLPVYDRLLKKWRLRDEEMCVIGDDLMELGMLRRAGLAVAVPNAVDEVKQAAHYMTAHAGGAGAVREVIDIILKHKGLWNNVVARYLPAVSS